MRQQKIMEVNYMSKNIQLKILPLWLLVSVILNGCSLESEDAVLYAEVVRKDFVANVPAVGELKAAKETVIGMPGGVFEPQVIAWLAEENKFVKKGEVVARLDSQKYVDLSKQENFNIEKADISYQSKEVNLGNEEVKIRNDSFLTEDELALADKYTVEDLRVFSRNEIIDSLKNKEYLTAKQEYINWRLNSHQGMSNTELELLNLQKAQYSAKLNMYKNILNQLEIVAPHDGVFVLDRNWRGEKPRVGQTTWPGRKIGFLPDMSEIKAKIFILESEAAGIKVGQPVSFYLDAYPDEIISGELEQIDSIAKARSNDNPVKYFEATVKINQQPLPHWRPGNQLKASILATDKKHVVQVPTQSIFFENGEYFVYKLDGKEWKKVTVELGTRSASLTEIVSGLVEGERVALFEPQGENNAVL